MKNNRRFESVILGHDDHHRRGKLTSLRVTLFNIYMCNVKFSTLLLLSTGHDEHALCALPEQTGATGVVKLSNRTFRR
jgi:hypothetical protein